MKCIYLVRECEACKQLETIPMYTNTRLYRGDKVYLDNMVYKEDGLLRVVGCQDPFIVCDVFYNTNDDTICYHVCHEDDKEGLNEYGMI